MAVDSGKKKGKASRAKPKHDEDAATQKKHVQSSPEPMKRKATEDASPVAAKKARSSATRASKKANKEQNAAVDTASEPKKGRRASEKSRPEPAEPVAPVAEDEAEDDDDENDGTLALARTLGYSEDEDEDAEVASKSLFKKGQDVGVIPKVSSKTKKGLEGGSHGGSRVIYIGHIPYGFFEHEIKQYLTQFGPITNLRLSRNKKTGASKGYAFVEFKDASTAAIVAKTMDSYLLFGRILKVKLVGPESQHETLFKGANRRFKKVPWNKMAGRELEKPRGQADWDVRVEKETRRRSTRASKLREIGYEFEAPTLKPASAAIDGAKSALEAPPPAEDEQKAIEAPPVAAPEEPEADDKINDEAEGLIPVAPAKAAAAKKGTKAKKGSRGKKGKS